MISIYKEFKVIVQVDAKICVILAAKGIIFVHLGRSSALRYTIFLYKNE